MHCTKKTLQRFIIFTILLVSLLRMRTQQSAANLTLNETQVDGFFPGQLTYIYFDPNPQQDKLYLTSEIPLQATKTTANIQVNYNGDGWTPDAINTFEFAASVWEMRIESDVTIVVNAEFISLEDGILGGAGPTTIHRNFPGAPMSNTWYAAALANVLAGTDRNGSTAEIKTTFNENIDDWYFGIDGDPPATGIDFASVAMHEIGHGLGFFGSMTVSGANGYWGYDNDPFVYDLFTKNGAGQSLMNDFPNNSTALAAELTGNNIFFAGPRATAVNQNSPVELFAPDSWVATASYNHLGASFNNSANALMTNAIGDGVAIHTPGAVTLGILEDLGWTITTNTTPTISTLPTIFLDVGTSQNNAIDLWAYSSDTTNHDSTLAFTIINQTDPIVGATIDSNRYIDINPTDLSWTGNSDVTVQVVDPEGLAATGVFSVKSRHKLFLPLISN